MLAGDWWPVPVPTFEREKLTVSACVRAAHLLGMLRRSLSGISSMLLPTRVDGTKGVAIRSLAAQRLAALSLVDQCPKGVGLGWLCTASGLASAGVLEGATDGAQVRRRLAEELMEDCVWLCRKALEHGKASYGPATAATAPPDEVLRLARASILMLLESEEAPGGATPAARRVLEALRTGQLHPAVATAVAGHVALRAGSLAAREALGSWAASVGTARCLWPVRGSVPDLWQSVDAVQQSRVPPPPPITIASEAVFYDMCVHGRQAGPRRVSRDFSFHAQAAARLHALLPRDPRSRLGVSASVSATDWRSLFSDYRHLTHYLGLSPMSYVEAAAVVATSAAPPAAKASAIATALRYRPDGAPRAEIAPPLEDQDAASVMAEVARRAQPVYPLRRLGTLSLTRGLESLLNALGPEDRTALASKLAFEVAPDARPAPGVAAVLLALARRALGEAPPGCAWRDPALSWCIHALVTALISASPPAPERVWDQASGGGWRWGGALAVCWRAGFWRNGRSVRPWRAQTHAAGQLL